MYITVVSVVPVDGAKSGTGEPTFTTIPVKSMARIAWSRDNGPIPIVPKPFLKSYSFWGIKLIV